MSPVTNKLWQKFYMEEFGASRADQAVENTRNANAAFRWKELLEAEVEEVKKKENKAAEKLKSRYQMEADRKQSRCCCLHRGRAMFLNCLDHDSLQKTYSSKKDSTIQAKRHRF
ncbi:hypothetical protein ACFX2C_005971 [Malus domestica]